MVRARDDVDVLIELADRTINAARNAGIDRASGDAIAFLDHTLTITDSWRDAVHEGLAEFDAVSGPTRTVSETEADSSPEQRTIAGREIPLLNAGNVAFTREVTERLDGFDEYLDSGGAQDFAHRLAANDFATHWDEQMSVNHSVEADGGRLNIDRDSQYRALAYRLSKNYNLRPAVLKRLVGHASRDAFTELRAVIDGERRPSQWFGSGKTVVTNLCRGIKDGLAARRRDKTSRRNPNGRSARADRAVTVYDWRD
jgi:glycosyltransferase involved in cell wall biosynthesis